MEKDLCFIIDKEKLYLDKVLVDYEGIPLFFICKSEKSYFVSLCIDIDNPVYIVSITSLVNIYKMLYGRIEMRNLLTETKCCWKVISGNEIEEDTVESINSCDLKDTDLPEKGAFYKAFNKDDNEYINKIDNLLFSNEFEKLQVQNEIKEDNLQNRYLKINSLYGSIEVDGCIVKKIGFDECTVEHSHLTKRKLIRKGDSRADYVLDDNILVA